MVRRRALIWTSFAMLTAMALAAPIPSAAQAPPEEGTRVATLPAPTPHWTLIYSIASLGSFAPSSVTIVDGDTRRVLGMMDGGLGSSFAVAPSRREFYMADTYYSRGARGDRTDVVTIYDAKTLNPTGEVVIPPKRQLTAQDNATIGVTPDGKLLLVANMTPATSATVVDLKRKKVLGEIQMSGCTETLVTGNRQFVSLCGDGSMMTTDFDDTGKATSQKRTTAPFFDPEKDPVWALPAVVGKQAYFLSYHGVIYPVDLSTDPATAGKSWPLLTQEEIGQNWRPGGVQQLAVDTHKGLLYILMHQGGEWSHKMPGVDVWVYDLKTQKRVRKMTLAKMADSIALTPDADPLLVAVMQVIPPATLGYAEFYSVSSGKMLGTIDNLPVLFEHIYQM
jgi:methylamine dehydrogenase heavy chain